VDWVLDSANDAACQRIAAAATEVLQDITRRSEVKRTGNVIATVFAKVLLGSGVEAVATAALTALNARRLLFSPCVITSELFNPSGDGGW
jgi:uncharacterized membrane protein